MRYPAIGKQATRAVSISRLDGGLNLRDGLTQCADNQLTEAVNVWYTGGELRTRPALIEKAEDIKEVGFVSGRLTKESFGSGTTDIYYNRSGTDYRMFWYSFYDENIDITRFCFRFSSERDFFALPEISVNGRYTECFAVQHKNKIYAFICELGIWSYSEAGRGWSRVNDNGFYAPLVLSHCKAEAVSLESGFAGYTGTAVEGYNLLGCYYRMVYSTVNRERLESAESEHNMIYPLAQRLNGCKGKTVTAYLTTAKGKFIHSLTINCINQGTADETVVAETADRDPGDGLVMKVYTNNSIAFYNSSTDAVATVKAENYIEDNLEITAPYFCENADRVMNMRRAVWFGGASAGLSGGTRLFLGGSSLKNEQSLVLWSDLNNPLYFPEGCYAYVGNANTPVTAFGKQNDCLIIFKSNEIFYTQYTQGNAASAADLIEQKTGDLTTTAAYFPMIQLNSVIGCDCPDTVQICRNRLVWATKAGKVFTMISQNQYSERNIYEVSEMVSSALREQAAIKDGYALSADWKGRYMLFCGSRVFVMDYNSYGFIYAASHAKNEDANMHIPWFYWELPFGRTAMLFSPLASVTAVGDTLKLNYIFEIFKMNDDGMREHSSYYLKTAFMDINEVEDIRIDPGELFDWNLRQQLPIKTVVRTRLFELGAPYLKKHIPLIQLGLGDNKGRAITVSYITDAPGQPQADIIYPQSYGVGELDSAYGGMVVLRPPIRFCRSLSVELSCDGAMAIQNITVYYRITGGVK